MNDEPVVSLDDLEPQEVRQTRVSEDGTSDPKSPGDRDGEDVPDARS